MKLKRIDGSRRDHAGYGAGSGHIIQEEYECPCGKGVVTYEKDDIPGFRESMTMCMCSECDEKFHFARGTAIEK